MILTQTKASEDWSEFTLGDALDVKHGWAFKGEFMEESNSPSNIVVAIGNFKYSGGFRFESTKKKKYTADYPKEYELTPGDVLVAMTCQTAGGEILGIPGVIPDDKRTYLHNQRLGKLEVIDSDRLDIAFAYWLCLWRNFNHHLVSTSSGTKILHTAPERIKSFTFKCPPLEEQKAIAAVLSCLDRKIENLRKQSETLEAIAQTLFKRWFIDFEFPYDFVQSKPSPDGQPYKSSGGAMHPSELGEIPEGWRVCTVEEIAKRIATGPFGSRIKTENFVDLGVPVIRGNNLTDGFNESSFVFLTEEKASELKRSSVTSGDIVFTHRGTLGQVGIIPEQSKYPRYIVSQSQMLLSVDRQKMSSLFMYQFFRSRLGSNEILMHKNTTGVPSIAQPTSTLKNIEFVCPDSKTLKTFENLSTSLDLKANRNTQEIEQLTEARNLLLPKLMSGQLRITP